MKIKRREINVMIGAFIIHSWALSMQCTQKNSNDEAFLVLHATLQGNIQSTSTEDVLITDSTCTIFLISVFPYCLKYLDTKIDLLLFLFTGNPYLHCVLIITDHPKKKLDHGRSFSINSQHAYRTKLVEINNSIVHKIFQKT